VLRLEESAMSAFLKIENVGVCPPEAFTLLGVSLADQSSNKGMIGHFGSGSKQSLTTLGRHSLWPVIFSGMLRMLFGSRSQIVADSRASKEFARVFVEYSGIDPFTGASRSGTEELGFVLAMGQEDWPDVSLAIREFVSNAVDRSIREKGNWSGVRIEVVDSTLVEGKHDCTRIFVPLTGAVLDFYNNLGKWFLHFSEAESLDKAILLKKNRNLGDRQSAVIYRRGVRVREFENCDTPSLFDYNLGNLPVDESRRATDWDVKYHAGRALINANRHILAVFFNQLANGNRPVWELTFDACSLLPTKWDSAADIARRSQQWQEAFTLVAGDSAVLTGSANVEQLLHKGYKPIVAPESILAAAERYGVNTPAKVLSADDLAGREVFDSTPGAEAAVEVVWQVLEDVGLCNGKAKPATKCFTSILNAGTKLNGFYRDGTVFINSDLASASSIRERPQELSERLLKCALEEVAHHVTGSTDCSRDFQDFLLHLAVKLARSKRKPLPRIAATNKTLGARGKPQITAGLD
jgi:hypothetical protein